MTFSNGSELVTCRADEITPRQLRWLWPNRIPLGKIAVLAGLPGEGKSLATIDIAARVTTARKYPDVDNPLGASEVLFVAGEDDADDALVPRLSAANADRSKVHILNSVRTSHQGSRSLSLDVDMAAIQRFLDGHPHVRLLVIDPISNHLGRLSMFDEQEVRAALGPLQDLARTNDLAVIGVTHLNKKEGLSAIHRVSGAGAFIGVARASWLFARGRASPSGRFMMPLKNNYARESTSLGYRIDETRVKIGGVDVPTPYIEWLQTTHLNVEEIISVPRKQAPRIDAKVFLKDFLANGPQGAPDVYAAAAVRGISERTLDRAKSELAVESRKKGAEGWEWVLPDYQSKGASEHEGHSGTLGTLQLVTSLGE